MSARKSTDDLEFPQFSNQLVNISQFRPMRWYLTGIMAEIHACNCAVQRAGLSIKEEDVDLMMYSINHYAFPRYQLVPDAYSGEVISYDTVGVHSGYAKFVNEKDIVTVLSKQENNNGPAARELTTTEVSEEINSRGLAEVVSLNDFAPEIDVVQAYHCPYWPKEADEWISKTRLHGSPSKSLMKKVISYGCDFVCVSHKLSSNKDKHAEWRFSFSQAELIIVRSWTAKQRIVYRALWVVSKKLQSANKTEKTECNLRTYYFKTLMLWACEREASSFWIQSLCDITRRLLARLCHWLESKRIQNYFIPSNNMIDHLTDRDVYSEITMLVKFIFSNGVMSSFLEQCDPGREEMLNAQVVVQAEISAWLYTSLLLCDRIYNERDRYRNLFNNDYSQQLQDAVYAELSDVYQGLVYHKLSVACDTVSDREDCWHRARQHFSTATSYCQVASRVMVDAAFFHAVVVQFFYRINDDSVSSLSPQDLSIVKYFTFPDPKYDKQLFYVKWSDLSPTVNISWFISKVYLANFMYTAMCDYEQTVRVCDDIISECEKSECNFTFGELAFQVVLSTRRTVIYDEDVQALLGFYSLCKFLTNNLATPQSVHVSVCPIQFALYLKLRCALRSKESFREDCKDRFLQHAVVYHCKRKDLIQDTSFSLNLLRVLEFKFLSQPQAADEVM